MSKEELIKRWEKEAKELRNAYMVSMAEGVANEAMAEILERCAKELEEME